MYSVSSRWIWQKSQYYNFLLAYSILLKKSSALHRYAFLPSVLQITVNSSPITCGGWGGGTGRAGWGAAGPVGVCCGLVLVVLVVELVGVVLVVELVKSDQICLGF